MRFTAHVVPMDRLMKALPMMRTRTLSGLAAVMLAAVLAGCSASPSTPTTTTTATPSASSPTSLSPQQQAAQLAEPKVTEYIQTSDEISHSPDSMSEADMEQVAISTALIDLKNEVIRYKASGHYTTGDAVVVSVKQVGVDLTFKPKETPPSIPTVEYMVCQDVSKIRVFDKDGKDITQSDRADHALIKMGVSNYKYPATDQWRVAYYEWQKGETC